MPFFQEDLVDPYTMGRGFLGSGPDTEQRMFRDGGLGAVYSKVPLSMAVGRASQSVTFKGALWGRMEAAGSCQMCRKDSSCIFFSFVF